MKMTVNMELSLEQVEALVQELETNLDGFLRNFIERILLKVHEQSENIKESSDAFEKINPFSMLK